MLELFSRCKSLICLIADLFGRKVLNINMVLKKQQLITMEEETKKSIHSISLNQHCPLILPPRNNFLSGPLHSPPFFSSPPIQDNLLALPPSSSSHQRISFR
mmetsp:Transcript_21958/g.47681  ORF Transcript_21958/g.47681 Transcript_21958/m.47681 type:complete len:102 (-) Transcript_21958:822-1127(-)